MRITRPPNRKTTRTPNRTGRKPRTHIPRPDPHTPGACTCGLTIAMRYGQYVNERHITLAQWLDENQEAANLH